MDAFDVVIVGARCAGSTAALAFARRGARVALVDKDVHPSNVLSTHMLFPNTVARLEQLDVLERIRAQHRINPIRPRYTMFGNRVPGGWSPVEGIDHGISLRRPVLDTHLFEAAIEAGAVAHMGETVTGLVGAGTADDPVRGVTLANGDALRAPLVLGADGRSSIVARSLKLEKREEMRAPNSFLYAYLTGLPATEPALEMQVADGETFMRYPCEDDVEILIAGGDAGYTTGSAEDRSARFAATVARFDPSLTRAALDATTSFDLHVAPETLMRGYYRDAAGPGWALVGDAGHFKHPSTAQGICDAIEQALWIAAARDGDDPMLDGYGAWRDARSADHYAFSFAYATIPPDELGATLFRGVASEPDATRDFWDGFVRLRSPASLFTGERLARWMTTRT